VTTDSLRQSSHEARRLRATLALLRKIVGHDLRSPLQAVSGCADLLAYSTGGQPDARRLSHHLRQSSGRLLVMMEGARVLVDDVGPPMTWGPVSLSDWLPADLARGLLPPVEGDATLLRRALEALVDNARQHGAEPVRVSLTVEGGEAALAVSDAGPGVSDHQRDAIFRPFVSMTGGRGLGLTRARRALEDHGGSLTLDAGEPSTTFVARWPLEAPWFEPGGG